MPPHIALLDQNDDPLGPLTFTLQGGESSDPIEIHIANDLDDTLPGTTTATGYRFGVRVLEGGVPVTYGVPLLDELWARGQVDGVVNPGGVEMADQFTGVLPLGTGSQIPLEPIPPGTARVLTFQLFAPGDADSQTYVIEFDVFAGETSWPLSSGVTALTGSGVLPSERRGLLTLLRGSEIIADGTDTVVFDRGSLSNTDGRTVTFLRTDETFTLADSEAVNLGAGESYIVTVSRAPSTGAAVFTKGPKAETVERPETPAGNLYVGRLIVRSDDGVAVTVEQADVSQADVVYGDFHARPGVGLSVIIGSGQGITGTDLRQHVPEEAIVGVTASASTFIWRIAAGTYVTTAAEVAPELGADLLFEAEADAGAVTAIIDRRHPLHRALVMDRIEATWRGVLSELAEPSLGLGWAVNYLDDAEIEGFELNLTGTDESWTGGEIKADARLFAAGVAIPFPAGGAGAGGASIFVSAGTDDQRPTVAFDATDLRALSTYHETRLIPRGARVLFDLVTTMAGPGAEDEQEVRFTLLVRRRA